MKYDVKLSTSARKQLKRLDKKQAEKILVKVYNLAENPHPQGVVKLTGQRAYRIRISDYRVIYEVHNKALLVQIIRIGHRRDVYKP